MRRLVIDFETRSEVDLIAEGLMKYATHPSTDILMLGWKEVASNTSAQLWLPGTVSPHICNTIQDCHLYAFNAEFEMAIWNHVGVKKYGWTPLNVKDVTCLAALANRYGLPNQMGHVAEALQCKHRKNPEGKILIQIFCTPKHGWPKHEGDRRWERFKQYCLDDVLAEEEILQRLPAKELSDTERDMWEKTVHMNTRGIPVDVGSAKQIRRLSEQYRESLYDLLPEMTGGKVTKITQVKRIKDYCEANGYPLEDLTAYTVEKTLEEDLPDNIVELLEMRAAIGLSSIGKYIRLQEMSQDGKIYYNQRYYGAHTGRWTGSGVQLLNLPRAAIGANASTESERVQLVEDEITKFFDGRIVEANPIKAARALIRPMIKAEEGKLICAADYSAIEYVVLCWFAGMTEALERFDNGFDPYIDLASFMFKKAYEDVNKTTERPLGKVGVLLCGYGGGPLKIQESAEKQYKVKLTEEESNFLVKNYRQMYAEVVKMWYACARAAVEAVERPGKEIELYKVAFKVVRDQAGTQWLTIRLPSGRRLFYNRPFIEMGSRGAEVCHYGFNQKIKKWHVMRMIPGRIAENIVQAASRDILIHGMKHCFNEGIDVIWTCYDEIIAEIPEDRAEEYYAKLCDCMTRLEPWAAGIPIKAEGFYAKRYKKM